MGLGRSSRGLYSWAREDAGGVLFGGEVELSSEVALSGLKLNLGGWSNGLEPLKFGLLDFNIGDESLGCEDEISGVGCPNIPMPTFANGFGLEDGVPNMVGDGTNGWAIGLRPAVWFVKPSFGLEVSASKASVFVSSSD